MAETRGRKPEYDWNVIKGLFMASAQESYIESFRIICDQPEFKGLSVNFLRKKAYDFGWHKEKERLDNLQISKINSQDQAERYEAFKSKFIEFKKSAWERELDIYNEIAKNAKPSENQQKIRISNLDVIMKNLNAEFGLDKASSKAPAAPVNFMLNVHSAKEEQILKVVNNQDHLNINEVNQLIDIAPSLNYEEENSNEELCDKVPASLEETIK